MRRSAAIAAFSALLVFLLVGPGAAAEGRKGDLPYSLNLFAGRLTSNSWEDFFLPGEHVNFEDSYLAGAALARRVGGAWNDRVEFEVEGQIVRHFHLQNHWELNALATVRWNTFWWDAFLDTSAAFGLGPSYATDKAEIEQNNEGDTSRLLAYWMLEIAFALPNSSRTNLIARIHHRSNAFGLVADEGGSNALVLGLKYRF